MVNIVALTWRSLVQHPPAHRPRAIVCAFFRDARHNCAGSTAFGTALFAMLEVIYVYYTSRVLAPLAYRLRVQEEPRYPYVVLMSCLIL